ncbi:MAG: hypothetical protein ACPGZP_01305 [Panacagrimonas sp.]
MYTSLPPSRQVSLLILTGLALLMTITRFQPLDHFLELPDASWSVFFIAGFYLVGMARWAFPALIALSVAIDWVAIQHLGVSNYCVTPAYWFLIPTHAVMWFGGYWLRQRASQDWRGLLRLAASAFIASSVAYMISNGGFYWFGGRYPEPNVAQYLERFARYYQWFLLVPCAYIGTAALLHVGVQRAVAATVREDGQRPAND